jgi:hypothetical protein
MDRMDEVATKDGSPASADIKRPALAAGDRAAGGILAAFSANGMDQGAQGGAMWRVEME